MIGGLSFDRASPTVTHEINLEVVAYPAGAVVHSNTSFDPEGTTKVISCFSERIFRDCEIEWLQTRSGLISLFPKGVATTNVANCSSILRMDVNFDDDESTVICRAGNTKLVNEFGPIASINLSVECK